MNTKFSFLFVFFLTACVTVNIYFPAAAVQRAADEIVKETLGEPKGTGSPGGPQSGVFIAEKLYALTGFTREAFAQEPDIKVSNPAIRALRESMRTRFGSIRAFLDKGNVGINKDGELSVRTTEGLSLKERAEINQLVEAQNRDIEALHGEIARANNFPKEKIADIRRIFAKSWMDHAKTGWWIQDPQGNWSKK
ncbi:MAG: DUF1318 domain-containing protein [Deltaproteobacteria bacterium]|nr:MAG: DUF1318 domain-containing protein [Deltaproteobacteria bacterium]